MTQISANSAIMERLGRIEDKIDLLLAKQPYSPTEEEQEAFDEAMRHREREMERITRQSGTQL